jgi:hypothetical protein
MARFGYYRKPDPKPLRMCQRCKKQIKRSDRWTHAVNGKTEHWNCFYPKEPPEILATEFDKQQQTLPLGEP